MKRLLTIVAAIAVVFATTNFAVAGGNGGPGGAHGYSHGYSHGYNHGQSFGYGHYYPGNGFHWNYWGYSSRYGCNVYWSPTDGCYYYWCQPAGVYYPVTYIAVAPPTVVIQNAGPPVMAARPDGVPPPP